MSPFRVWLSSVSAVLLMAGAFTAREATAQQSQAELLRAVCANDALLKDYLDKVAAERGKGERVIAAFEIDEECGVAGMSPTPRFDTADAGPDASHTAEGQDARYSPDGKTILSASTDGTLRIWDTETGKPLRKIDVPGASPEAKDAWKSGLRSAIFIGDGSKIAVSSGASPVHLMETATGKLIAEIPFKGDLPGSSWAPHLASSAKGLLLIAGMNDDAVAYDAAADAVRYKLGGHNRKEANAVAVSDAAGLVATGTRSDKKTISVRLWKLETGERSGGFTYAGTDTPSAMAFSRDGAQLAVAYGGTVVVYNLADNRITQTVVVHPLFIAFGIAFTADGKGLLTCRAHPVLWDIATGKMVRRFGPFNDLCHSIDVSPDGKYAVTTALGSDVRIWEIATGAFYRRLGKNAVGQQ